MADADHTLIESTPPADLEFRFFTAGWCAPCDQLAPIVSEVCTETQRIVPGGAAIPLVVVDVDAEPDVADDAGIDALPVFQVLHNGQEVLRLQGSRPKREITRAVADIVRSIGPDSVVTSN